VVNEVGQYVQSYRQIVHVCQTDMRKGSQNTTAYTRPVHMQWAMHKKATKKEIKECLIIYVP